MSQAKVMDKQSYYSDRINIVTPKGRLEMGYYSEVALCLRTQAKKLLDEKLEEISENAKLAKELIEAADLKLEAEDGEDSSFLWKWSGVKWDEDYYGDVKFIMDFVDTLPTKDYKIIRVGEDYDDPVEDWGDFYDNPFLLSVSRSIFIDMPQEVK